MREIFSGEDNAFLPYTQKKEHISPNIVIIINTLNKQKIVPLQQNPKEKKKNVAYRLRKDIWQLPYAYEARAHHPRALDNVSASHPARGVPAWHKLNTHCANNLNLHRCRNVHTDEDQRREPLDA
jgi:hypothetical protein